VDGGHEALDDAKVLVDDLGERGQAVGGARGVGDDLHGGVELGVVDTHDEHGGIVGGGGDDDELGARVEVDGSTILGGEDTGGLDNDVGTAGSPGDLLGIHLAKDGDGAAVDDELVVLALDGALEAAVGGVVLGQVDHVVDGDEGIVNGNDLNVVPLERGTENQTTDPSESKEEKEKKKRVLEAKEEEEEEEEEDKDKEWKIRAKSNWG